MTPQRRRKKQRKLQQSQRRARLTAVANCIHSDAFHDYLRKLFRTLPLAHTPSNTKLRRLYERFAWWKTHQGFAKRGKRSPYQW